MTELPSQLLLTDESQILILLLDTSRSMDHVRLGQLNQLLQKLQHALEQNRLAARRLDVAVLTFGNSGVEVVQDFTREFVAPTVTDTGGEGCMGDALRRALVIIAERKNMYRTNAVSYYRPLMIVITSGEWSHDWESATEQLRAEEARKAVSVIPIAVANADLTRLSRLSRRPPITVQDFDFEDAFVWLSGSLDQTSLSLGDTVALEELQFSIVGQEQLRPGTSHDVFFFAHTPAHTRDLIGLVSNLVDDDVGWNFVASASKWLSLPIGTLLSVRMSIAGLDIVPNIRSIDWNGELGLARFRAIVPEQCVSRIHSGFASVKINGFEIANVRFSVFVGPSSAAGPAQLPTDATRHRSAFASYASKDRTSVMARVQGMQKVLPSLDIFVDVFTLRSGQLWEVELKRAISAADVFYLFWCRHARRSKWVTREWRYALEMKGLSFIDPVPLEGPQFAPPPRKLARIHFNDPILAFTKSEGHD